MKEIVIKRNLEMKDFYCQKVLNRNEADLCLSPKADLFDFFALGVFCLVKSWHNEQTPIKIFFSNAYRVRKSRIRLGKIVIGQRKIKYEPFHAIDSMDKAIADLVFAIFGKEIDQKAAYAVVMSKFFLHVMGYERDKNLAKNFLLMGEKPIEDFMAMSPSNQMERINDPRNAQKLAYDVISSCTELF